MSKENLGVPNAVEPNVRMTRSQAASLKASIGILNPKAPTQQNPKRLTRAASKRTSSDQKNSAADTKGPQFKRRALLQDVTNVCCQSSNSSCMIPTIIKNRRPVKKGATKISDIGLSVTDELQYDQTLLSVKTYQQAQPTKDGRKDVKFPETLKEKTWTLLIAERRIKKNESSLAESIPDKQITDMPAVNQNTGLKDERNGSPRKSVISSNPEITNIDSNQKDPLLCSLYASEIYSNLRVAELNRRPSTNFMGTVQSEISERMRGILIDWLVEVSEEYKLVPDTLYLTVHLIDCFLSSNLVEKQRLQLLGVTSMLIASKFEEICAPRVEEFCFITANTYTKEEVLNMEKEILNHIGFLISAPTTKGFLRRFVHAAQSSFKSPRPELEFLANYLAELTLIEYSFLNFLPSLIAGSVVFLAKWTLDQSVHPWNPTLEHYTYYKASDLKTPVLALQDLQWNTKNCPLTAIRSKYSQQKFKSVSALSSPKLLETLFSK